MRPKDEKKRSAIYQGALKIITVEGMAGASVSKIAREANVSPATIYIYFKNKEDMLDKLYLMVKKELSDYIFTDFTGEISPAEGITRYMRRLYHFMASHPLHLSFHEQFYNSPRIDASVKKKALEGYSPLFSLYEKGLREGTIRNTDPQLIGAFLNSPSMTLAKARQEGDMNVTEDMLGEAVEMVLRAVLV